jgi:hypothetical protein
MSVPPDKSYLNLISLLGTIPLGIKKAECAVATFFGSRRERNVCHAG